MKKFFSELKSYIIIIIVVVLIRTFIITPALVNGDSMYDTLEDKDLVIVNKVSLLVSNIKRFDIVVINNKKDKDKIIKRVIALPNEKIEYKNNVLYIDDEKQNLYGLKFENTEDFVYETKDNEYFVLGDNRDLSKDSRYLGAFKKEEIIGKVQLRIYPFNKFGLIE